MRCWRRECPSIAAPEQNDEMATVGIAISDGMTDAEWEAG